VIWGDYNSKQAMQLAIKFEMCHGHSNCKSEAEIREWLKGKFVAFIHNQAVFHADEFGHRSINAEAQLIFVPLSSQTR